MPPGGAPLSASWGRLVDRFQVGPRRTVRVLAEYAADLEDRALRALGRLHAARPRHSAIPRSQLGASFPDLANEAMAAGLIERLKAQGKVVADMPYQWLPATFGPSISGGERQTQDRSHGRDHPRGRDQPSRRDRARRRRRSPWERRPRSARVAPRRGPPGRDQRTTIS